MSTTDVKVTKTAAEEAAELQVEINKQLLRKAQLENSRLEKDIALLENTEERAEANAKSNGTALAASNRDEASAYTVCTHKKGGDMRTYPKGDGERGGYAILRHRLPNRDIYIRCLRCGKEWLPPVQPRPTDREFLKKDGTFDEGKYKTAYNLFKMRLEDYKLALTFNTDNKDSGSPTFMFKDQIASRKAFRGTNPPGSEESGKAGAKPVFTLPGGMPALEEVNED